METAGARHVLPRRLAAYALLNDARVDGLYFIDMDAYAPPEAFGVVPPLFAAAHGDGRVDVLFENARDPRTFWHIHGDTFYLRDAPLSRLFLREWITWRCGFKDQYSLWHAVLVRALVFLFIRIRFRRVVARGPRGLPPLRRRDLRQHDLPGGAPRGPAALPEPRPLLRRPPRGLPRARRRVLLRRRRAGPSPRRFRFCDDRYNITHQLWRHRGISAKATRAYAYAAGGATREVLVGDMLRADNGTAGDLLAALGLARADAATWLGVVV